MKNQKTDIAIWQDSHGGPVYARVPIMEKEFIIHEKQNEEAWICICGNTPVDDGFFPSNEMGEEVEPVHGLWDDLYVCNRCGRIIDMHTLEVVARREK